MSEGSRRVLNPERPRAAAMGQFDETGSGSLLKTATAVCGATVVALGALALSGWVSGVRVLASINPSYTTMAPDSAILFIAFGSTLCINAFHSLSRRGRASIAVVLALAALYGFLKAAGYFARMDLTFEEILFPITEKVGSFPIRRMSPVTGILFFLSGAAVWLLVESSNQLARNVAAALGIATLIGGFVATIGYLYGTPLLYGGEVIPLAATTAVAFFMLGSGIVSAAGATNVFLRPWVGSSVRARLLRAFVPLTAIAVLLQGLAHEVVIDEFGISHGLLTAVITLLFVTITSVVVTQVARMISRTIDQAETERRQAEEKYRTIVDSAVEGIFQSTPEGRFLTVNPALAHMWGYASPEELIASITDIAQQVYVDPSRRAEFRQLVEVSGRVQGFEFQARRKDGSVMWVSENARAVRDARGALLYYEGTVEDITARRQAERELEYVSLHDALTGLFNRHFFEQELARWEHSRHFPFSIVVADLNGLKQINDSQGHPAGDELLRRAAQVFKAAFRAEDAVARIGGDEFAVLLPETDGVAAAQAVRRIRDCIAAENNGEPDSPLSFAMGVASGDQEVSLFEIMKTADRRMYDDKLAQGKNGGGQ